MKQIRKFVTFIMVLALVITCLPMGAFVKADTKLKDTLTEKIFSADASHVKVIGRTYYNAIGERWLANTDSGIEFTFTGTKASVTLLGDAMAEMDYIQFGIDQARIGIYVNGKLVVDDMLKQNKKTYDFYNSDQSKPVTVRIIKLSECGLGTVGIADIKVTSADGIHPTPEKTHKIEFIGDSLTNAYGVENHNVNGQFSNSTENGTKSFAYKTAQNLNADYSMFAISGFGVITGVTSDGSKDPSQSVSMHYEKISYAKDWVSDVRQCSCFENAYWDFSQFQPDVIVINLGTNDYNYYVHDIAERKKEFVDGYVAFLRQIRLHNTKATIFCTMGICGAEAYPEITSAVESYKKLTGDTNVTTMKFAEQKESDGICLHGHPSEKTYTKAATKLTSYIKKVMGW